MKSQGNSGVASIPSSSPTGSSVQVFHDYQKIAFKMHPKNGHVMENGSHAIRGQVTTSVPGIIPNNMDDDGAQKSATWMIDSSSQVCSGPEDNSTDPQETLTETSTLTFVDAHIMEDSAENHSVHGVGMVYLKEFVLIDDDDDGDMSLREKTVTDVSVMDGRAADLVCRRLFSTSSGSLSEGKAESPSPEAPPPEEIKTTHDKTGCCLCSIL